MATPLSQLRNLADVFSAESTQQLTCDDHILISGAHSFGPFRLHIPLPDFEAHIVEGSHTPPQIRQTSDGLTLTCATLNGKRGPLAISAVLTIRAAGDGSFEMRCKMQNNGVTVIPQVFFPWIGGFLPVDRDEDQVTFGHSTFRPWQAWRVAPPHLFMKYAARPVYEMLCADRAFTRPPTTPAREETIGQQTLWLGWQYQDWQDVRYTFKDIPAIAQEARQAGFREMSLIGVSSAFCLPHQLIEPLDTPTEFKEAIAACQAIGVNAVPIISCRLINPNYLISVSWLCTFSISLSITTATLRVVLDKPQSSTVFDPAPIP